MPRSTQKTEDQTENVTEIAPVSIDTAEVVETPEQVETSDTEAADTAPEPDEFGRYRVLDNDTGHRLSINAPGLPHGNFTVLEEPASDPSSGEALPPVHKSPVETTTDGQQAENKEKHDG